MGVGSEPGIEMWQARLGCDGQRQRQEEWTTARMHVRYTTPARTHTHTRRAVRVARTSEVVELPAGGSGVLVRDAVRAVEITMHQQGPNTLAGGTITITSDDAWRGWRGWQGH